MSLWNTEESEIFSSSLAPFYYVDSDVVLVVCDGGDGESVKVAKKWVREVKGKDASHFVVFVITWREKEGKGKGKAEGSEKEEIVSQGEKEAEVERGKRLEKLNDLLEFLESMRVLWVDMSLKEAEKTRYLIFFLLEMVISARVTKRKEKLAKETKKTEEEKRKVESQSPTPMSPKKGKKSPKKLRFLSPKPKMT